ncbi:MAG: MFS transporter [Chloroflexota bacterium]|nr:MFS transporter [Chloroflexota bacterium]
MKHGEQSSTAETRVKDAQINPAPKVDETECASASFRHSEHQRKPIYARVNTLSSLVERDWRVLWLAGHLWHSSFWMDLIILGWVVLELTNSPLLVSLVGTFRLLPMGLLGFFAGSQADRMSKKRLLMAAQVLNISVTAVFTLMLALGVVQVWHIFVVAALTGSAWAIDFPVRRAFIRDLLPEALIFNAMALDAASLTGTMMLGRWLAGGLLATVGATGAYAWILGFYVAGFILLITVSDNHVANEPRAKTDSVWGTLLDGLRYTWGNGILRGVLVMTIVVNLLVVPYMQLTPVFARDVFHVGPGYLGLMSGMEGMGALIGTLVLASLGVVRRRGLLFLGGSFLLGIGVLLFSLSTSFVVAILMLIVAGLGVSGFATMQTTITVTTAEPRMRGSAMGAVTLAIGLLPIGMFMIGLLTEWLGAPRAVTVSSLLGLGAILAITALQSSLRRA